MAAYASEFVYRIKNIMQSYIKLLSCACAALLHACEECIWISPLCFYFSYCPLYRIWRQVRFFNVFLFVSFCLLLKKITMVEWPWSRPPTIGHRMVATVAWEVWKRKNLTYAHKMYVVNLMLFNIVTFLYMV